MPLSLLALLIVASVIGFIVLSKAKKAGRLSDKQLRGGATIVFAGLSVLAAGAVLSLFARLFADDYAYWTHGERSVATITDLTREGSSTGSSLESAWTFYVHYEFVVDGRSLTKKDRLDAGRGFDDLSIGAPIDIVYDARDAARNRSLLATPIISRLTVAGFFLAMTALVLFVARKIVLIAFRPG